MIDYDDKKSLLINDGQNKIGPSMQTFINDVGKINNIDDIKRAYHIFMTTFNHNKNNQVPKFFRTTEEIALSKIWSGCSDAGTIFAPLLRANNIPTVYVQAGNFDWIKELLNNTDKKNSILGHVFLESYISNKWYLIDPTNGFIYDNYNHADLSLPKGYYAFSKSLNGHEVGCNSLQNNSKIMFDKFKNFDLNKYQNPNYIIISLHNETK
jgi:hypothetical protein